MTNLEQSIKNSLPDLMVLGVGCEFVELTKEKPPIEKFVVLKDNVGIYRTGNLFTQNDITYLGINATETYDSFIVNPKHFNHYKWLKDNQPNPITLPDVLRWLEKDISKIGLKVSTNTIKLINLWDLTIPNLSDQPQPVKDFLSNLMPKEK